MAIWSYTWKDVLEVRRVINESIARLRYALKHVKPLTALTTKASFGPTTPFLWFALRTVGEVAFRLGKTGENVIRGF